MPTSRSYQKIDRFLSKDNEITLKVISLPKNKAGKHTFTAQINRINSSPLNLKVKVMDYTKDMDYLSIYQLRGKLSKRIYHNRSFYYVWVKTKTIPKELPLGAWNKLNKKVSFYILDVFKRNCSNQAYRFLSAVFLGRRELLENEREQFSNVGVSHLLAISGLHMGLTSLILFFILRLIGLKLKKRLIVSLIFLCFYTFLTGVSPSTLRALIMFCVFALGFFIKRKVTLLNSLALAGLVSLMIEPWALFAVGFQLSFTAVFAIILGFKIFKVKATNNLPLNYLKYIFFCSLFVTLFTVPLVSYYFGKIYVLSIFYNIILIPFFTFILGLNFIFIVFSGIGLIAQSLGAVLSLLVWLFLKLVSFLGVVPFSFISCKLSLSAVFVYYFIFAALTLVIWFDKKRLV